MTVSEGQGLIPTGVSHHTGQLGLQPQKVCCAETGGVLTSVITEEVRVSREWEHGGGFEPVGVA